MKISIHTFLTEGDPSPLGFVDGIEYFNPHLPHRRWLHKQRLSMTTQAISIHTFLTEGDPFHSLYTPRLNISIHTFLTEGDTLKPFNCLSFTHFNPHLPHRRWQQFSTTTPPLPPPIINYIVQYSPTKSIAIFLLLPILSFSRCESPGVFILTSDSHQLTTLLSPFI